jgi:hypothetical protein
VAVHPLLECVSSAPLLDRQVFRSSLTLCTPASALKIHSLCCCCCCTCCSFR